MKKIIKQISKIIGVIETSDFDITLFEMIYLNIDCVIDESKSVDENLKAVQDEYDYFITVHGGEPKNHSFKEALEIFRQTESILV